jgi:hypothetical protein
MGVPPRERSAEPSGDAPPPGVPGWVKVLGAVVGGLILLAVLLQLTGIGDHGPGRHGTRMHGAAGEEVSSPVIVGAPALAVNVRQLAFEPDRVPGHRQAGMELEFVVADGAAGHRPPVGH